MKRRGNGIRALIAIFAVFGLFFGVIPNVFAVGEHEFTFKFYTCDLDEDALWDQYDPSTFRVTTQAELICNDELTEIAPGSKVEVGSYIIAAVHYKPGVDTDYAMQVKFNYDTDSFEPTMFHKWNRSKKEYSTSFAYGVGEDFSLDYNWEADAALPRAGRITISYMDNEGSGGDMLVDELDLNLFYFKVLDNGEKNTDIVFEYDRTYGTGIAMANKSAYIATDGVLQVKGFESPDNTLGSLTVKNETTNYTLSPTFTPGDKTNKTFTAIVPGSITSVDIDATPNEEHATVGGTGTKANLQYGNNSYSITVLSQSGDLETYTVNVYRLSDVNTLSALALSNVDFGTFNSATTSYTATVPYTTDKTNVTATATAGSKATLTGVVNNKALSVGANTVSVKVTPENCQSQYTSVPGNTCTEKTYTVTVTRSAASTNANAATLTVDGVSVPNFNPDTLSYTLDDVNYAKSSVEIAATSSEEHATITGTGTKTLSVGSNALKVKITAQDGTTSKEYTINIKRKNNDATLKALSVTSTDGTLTPTFSPTTTEYTYTVGPDVTSVSITGTRNDTNANMIGGGTVDPRTTTSSTITVTSEDGSQVKNYVVTIVRTKSNNADLSALSVTGRTIFPTFNKNTLEYTLTVPSTVDSITINATRDDDRASMTGDGTKQLSVGEQTFPIVVTAENGTTKKTYNVKVTKLSGDATLKSLTLSDVTFTPTFSSDVTSYTATVPYTTASTTVNGVKNDANATVSGNTTKQLNVGANTIKVTVTAQDTNVTKEYTVVVTREAASTDAKAATLTVDGVSVPNFDPNTLSYTLDDVVFTKSSVEIAATSSEEHATITGTGTKDLALGNNALKVKITAQDGTTNKEYTINIRRNNNDATLKALSVTSSNGTLSPTFSPSTTDYTYTVGPDVTSVTVTGTKNDTKANMIGGGTLDPRTETSSIITVTSEDGTDVKNYTVTIVRNKSNNADLSALSVTGRTITPTFNKDTLSYSLTVPSDVDSIEINATRADDRATMTGDGVKTITTGLNPFIINVVAEDTTTTKSYTVNVTKLDGDADLKSLSLSNVTYTPAFNKDTLSYTATVPYTTSSTTVSAERNSTLATITGTGDKSLAVGDNTIKVKVTAQDTNVSKEYVVTVTREAASTDDKAATLTVDGVSVPNFDPDQLTYELDDVQFTKTSVVIAATSSEEHATITGTGTKDLALGDNTFKVRVTAQDGTSYKEYTIKIRRNNNVNTLSGIEVPGVDLTPVFDPNTTEYTGTVDSTVDTITINTDPTDDNSTVSGDGDHTLQPGDNRIPVTVTPEDGSEPETYYINIHKNNDDTTLSDLALSGVDFGTFDPATRTYTATVPYTTSNTNVTATPTDDKALVEGTGNKVLNVGENTITVTVKAEDRNVSDTYTVTVTREAASTDATLSDLTVDGTTIEGFSPDTFEYFLTVENSKTQVVLDAVAADTTATITGTGTKDLAVKDNTFKIDVTSQSNETLSYTVHIRRKSNDSTLKSLTITSDDGILEPIFNPATLSYTYTAGPDVTSVTVTGEANDDDATVDGNTTVNPFDTNEVKLKVTAEDDSYTEYVISITRTQSSNKDLNTLSVEGYDLDPTFDPDTTSYTVTVPNGVENINIVATPDDDKADVDGTGTKPVSIGDNTFTVEVTPEDGSEPKVYTIVVTRAPSSDATLSEITIDGDPLSGFDPNTTSYDLPDVPKDKDSINIGATPNEDGATVSGTGDIPLIPGDNTIPINVVAPDGTPQTYELHVFKEYDDNNYLSALSIEGISLNETFDKTVQNYTASIPENTTSVNVIATPEVTTSTVSGDGNVDITQDEQVITVTVTSQANVPREYKITVTKTADNEMITSIAYGHDIDDTYILSGNLNAKVINMKDELDNDNSKLEVWNHDESVMKTDTDYIGTGDIVKLIINNQEKDRKIIVVKGDVNGDGTITLVDAVATSYHYVGTKNPDSGRPTLEGAYLKAGNVNTDDTITLVDAVAISYHYVGTKNPSSGRPLLEYKSTYTRD